MTDWYIATIGSHSALQILKGAKDEGFKTMVICLLGREKPYKMFGVADEILLMESYADYFRREAEILRKGNAIIIPHASFIEYVTLERVNQIKLKYFGNREILQWEADRGLQRQWLKKAGLHLPRIYEDAQKIDGAVIVKFHGAKGGQGYFLANSEGDFRRKIQSHPGQEYIIQEYIIGVPIYIHYFYSPLNGELEIMSFDKRYESNVDSLGRISARDQMALADVDPSYVIVGNIPVVVRESLLPMFIEIGESIVEVSKTLVAGGLIGPFCLEGILTPKQQFVCFEISARIVAGTNPFVQGSPYSQLKYSEPMSTGRRIAREIKLALASDQLGKICG